MASLPHQASKSPLLLQRNPDISELSEVGFRTRGGLLELLGLGLDRAFGQRCVLCQKAPTVVCDACEASLARSVQVHFPPSISQVSATYSYAGTAQQLMSAYKFANRVGLGLWLAARLKPPSVDVDVVTWVPCAKSSFSKRGYDTSELMARGLARRLGVPVARLLRRGRDGQQHVRSAQQRWSGPWLRPTLAAFNAQHGRVLLVDDVMTTGASLATAGRILRCCGASEVQACVAAVAPTHSPRV